MAIIHSTRIVSFAPFVRFLTENGADVSRYLAEIGMAPERLVDPESLVPLPVAARFITMVSRREGVDHIGLEAGKIAGLEDLGQYGMLLAQSLTLGDLLQRAEMHCGLLSSGFRAWLEPSPADPECARFCVAVLTDEARTMSDSYGLKVFLNVTRRVLGNDWQPSRVWLDIQGAAASSFELLSNARIERSVGFAAFEISREALRTPVAISRSHGDSSTPLEMLKTDAPPLDLAGSVRMAVRAGFGARIPGVEVIADMAGFSVSTLQRRLREAGLSFHQLLDQVRFDEARELMGRGDISIEDAARHLGYSDGTNFTHAFRRWAGVPPSRWRRAQPPTASPDADPMPA